MGNLMGEPDNEGMLKALAAQIPNRSERILVLLGWYGSGEGPWSGFPSYESTAENLLLAYETGETLAAINKADLTPWQTEGAARLFAGWHFSRLHPDDLKKMDAGLKKRLLEHSLQSDDEDKKDRAKGAFSP